MRVATRVLPLLALAVALTAPVLAVDAEQQTEASCIAPKQLEACEAKVDIQTQECSKRVETEVGECKRVQQDVDVKLQKEQEERLAVAKALEEAKGELASCSAPQVVEKLDATVEELKTTIDGLRREAASQALDLDLERSRSADLEKLVKKLKKDIQEAKAKSDALKQELAKVDERVSLSALLSVYYDQGVVLADNGVRVGRKALKQIQAGKVPDAFAGPVDEATKLYNQYYALYLAERLDPVLEAANRNLPIAEAKALATSWTLDAVQHVKTARAKAIEALEQVPSVAVYAEPTVNVLMVFAVLLFFNLIVFPIVWWCVRTTICLMTCGMCCAKKRSKSAKRKARALKQASMAPNRSRVPAVERAQSNKSTEKPKTKQPVSPPSSTSSRPASASRRTTGRKHK